jgi:serine/threonine protein kinase
MLETGLAIFDCEIVKPLAENNVFQSYLVSCSGPATAKLLWVVSDQLTEQKNRQHFLDQAHWLSSQTFPAIGTPIRAGEVDGRLLCLYPVSSGQTLSQSLETGFSARQAVELIAEITQHLIAPHSAGLVHGNLSATTIHLENHTPYLADFALAQLIRLNYQSGIDPSFISPEQVRGDVPGPAADIYCLGCVFYYLLTGSPPFSGDDAFHVAVQHLQDKFPKLPDRLVRCQPILDAMTKAVCDERLTANLLLDEMNHTIATGELDQISTGSVTEPGSESAEPAEEKKSEQQGETIENSDFAARIEARLREHTVTIDDAIIPASDDVANLDATEGLEHIYAKKESPIGRYFLILIIGILIGSGSYFLFFNQPVSLIAESEEIPESNLPEDLDRALLLWQNADVTTAEAEFKKIIAQYSTDPRAYNNLAAIYASQGHYEQARESLEHALTTNTDYATVYSNLGAVYTEMARDSYGRALQLDNAQAQLNLKAISSKGVVVMFPVAEVATGTLAPESVEPENTIKETGVEKISSVATVTLSESITEPVDPEPTVADKRENEEQTVFSAEIEDEVEKVRSIVTAVEDAAPVEEDNGSPVISSRAPRETVEDFMARWAQAWSDQDVPAYLAFYDDSFIPAGGKTRADWEKQRQKRITGPESIKVAITNLQLSEQENGRLRIEAIQTYKSDVFSDRTQKIFDLQKKAEGWSILRERSLESVR